MNNSTIAIIGYGMVGKATGSIFEEFDTYDFGETNYQYHDYAIVCLPTPTVDGKQDLSAVEEWLQIIKEADKNAGQPSTVILRSTVLPGTTDRLAKKYGLQIVHVPEFLTESTALQDARKPEFLVVGSRDIITQERVVELFRGARMYINKVITCSPTTAEMLKYAMNSFFALKVIYANELWDMCQTSEADYNVVKDALETHKWGSKNGWDVYHGGYRGFGGKCLPKDLEALVAKFDTPLLKVVQTINKGLVGEGK